MWTQEGFILPSVPLQFVLLRVCLSLEEALSLFTGPLVRPAQLKLLFPGALALEGTEV